MTEWFYSDGDEPNGPHAEEDIRSLLLVGTLDKTALVWRDGMSAWSPVRSQPEFAGLFPVVTPPPLPPRTLPPAQPIMAPRITPKPIETASAPVVEMAMDPEPGSPPETRPEREDGFFVEPPAREPVYEGSTGLAGPWTRYFARTFDMSLIGTVIATGISLALPYISMSLSLQWYVADSRGVFIVMLPVIMLVNAVIISVFGNSLGKAIFGIKAVPVSGGKRFTLRDHVGREMSVWTKGLFLGIPILSFFTMVPAYRKVRDKFPTNYDIGLATVRAYSNSGIRRFIGILVTLLLLGGIYTINAVEKVDQQQLRTASRWTNPVTKKVAVIPPGWQHEITTGPENNRLDAFTNVYTGVVAFMAVETGNITLEQYKLGLQTALASTSPLGPWTPGGMSIPMSKASGQAIEGNYPTTLYITQVGADTFWRVVYIDMTKSTPREITEPEMTMALMGTVR